MNVCRIAFGAALAASTSAASAAVITFDNVLNCCRNVTADSPYNTDDFSFANSGGNGSILFLERSNAANRDPDGATFTTNYPHTTTTLTRQDHTRFDFKSIDLVDLFTGTPGGQVRFTFDHGDGVLAQQIVVLPGFGPLQTFTFNEHNIVSAAWLPLTTFGGYLELDNVVVSVATVPLPAPSLLFGGASGAIALWQLAIRRRGVYAVRRRR